MTQTNLSSPFSLTTLVLNMLEFYQWPPPGWDGSLMPDTEYLAIAEDAYRMDTIGIPSLWE